MSAGDGRRTPARPDQAARGSPATPDISLFVSDKGTLHQHNTVGMKIIFQVLSN